MTYSEKLKDPRWQRKRFEILNRDGWRCLDCLSDEKTLHVHHCRYAYGQNPWDYDNSDLRSLCWECHEKRGPIEHDVKLEFARFLASRTADEIADMMGSVMAAHSIPPGMGLRIIGAFEFECLSTGRWLSFGVDNPAFRPIYEKITGEQPKWEDLF